MHEWCVHEWCVHEWCVHVCMSGVCMSGVCTSGVCMSGVCMCGVCMSGVCTSGVCMSGVCMSGVCMRGVCMCGVCTCSMYTCGVHTKTEVIRRQCLLADRVIRRQYQQCIYSSISEMPKWKLIPPPSPPTQIFFKKGFISLPFHTFARHSTQYRASQLVHYTYREDELLRRHHRTPPHAQMSPLEFVLKLMKVSKQLNLLYHNETMTTPIPGRMGCGEKWTSSSLTQA